MYRIARCALVIARLTPGLAEVRVEHDRDTRHSYASGAAGKFQLPTGAPALIPRKPDLHDGFLLLDTPGNVVVRPPTDTTAPTSPRAPPTTPVAPIRASAAPSACSRSPARSTCPQPLTSITSAPSIWRQRAIARSYSVICMVCLPAAGCRWMKACGDRRVTVATPEYLGQAQRTRNPRPPRRGQTPALPGRTRRVLPTAPRRRANGPFASIAFSKAFTSAASSGRF